MRRGETRGMQNAKEMRCEIGNNEAADSARNLDTGNEETEMKKRGNETKRHSRKSRKSKRRPGQPRGKREIHD